MKILKKPIIIIFVILFTFSVALAIGTTFQALISEKMVDAAIALDGNQSLKYVAVLGGIIAAILICEYFRKKLIAIAERKLTHTLRGELLNNYLNLSFSMFRKHSAQEYVSFINNDAQTVVGDYYLMLEGITFFIFSIILYTVALIWIYPMLALIVVLTNALPLLIPLFFKKRLANQKKDAYAELGKYNVKLSQAIIGFPAIRFNQIRKLVHSLHNDASESFVNKKFKFINTKNLADILVGAFSYVCLFALLASGIYFIINGKLTIGGLFAAMMISEAMVIPTINLSSSLNTFVATKAVKKNLFNAFAVDGQSPTSQKISIDRIESIEFKGVSFSYDNTDTNRNIEILSDINLIVNNNEKCIITGSNGSGKSTIIRLLLGQYDNYSGEILINGINLTDINIESLYSIIGYAEQQPMIFYDTLFNNITMFKKYDEQSIQKAMAICNIDKLENLKLNQTINKETELSDGERQKIALARLYLQGKKVLVLDEAMTSLDNDSYNQIVNEWLKTSDITLVQIDHSAAHRKTGLYDKLFAVKDGKIFTE